MLEAEAAGLPVPPYRPLEPVLAEAKIGAQFLLGKHQDQFHFDIQQQDRALDESLRLQTGHLQHALLTNRPGFQRPEAVLAMYEKRTEEEERIYKEWQTQQIKYHVDNTRFTELYGNLVHSDLGCAQPLKKKQAEIQALGAKNNVTRDVLVKTAAQREADYGEHLRVSVEEMQERQRKMFKELQDLQAHQAQEAALQRRAAMEGRMAGLVQVQTQQRNLRETLKLERDHGRLRLVAITSKAAEHRRALSLGAPAWLHGITPRPQTG